ncbi:MAG: helix-turn-helix transcriptional regulator [Clostridia bacterium]|nr:helix-turn-helix transcriptional regulator [Clostridia bacterium]
MANIPPYKEMRTYEKNRYWHVYQWNKTGVDTSVGMHYDNSVEINFFFNTVVDAYIGGKHYVFKEDCAILVMPNVIHSFTYENGDGTVIAFNLDTNRLKPIFDIDAFLAHHGIHAQNLPAVIPMNDALKELSQDFLSLNSLTDCFIAFLKFFRIAKNEMEKGTDSPEVNASHNDELRTILSWTRQNMHQKISIDAIAQLLGYNKSYFCRKFKNATGMTYIAFLNHIRICEAHRLLKRGVSVGQACDAIGFEDTSYFISLFKKQYGITPKKFIEQIKNNAEKET